MGKPVEYGTPLGWASFMMFRANFIVDRATAAKAGPSKEMSMRALFLCRLDMKDMVEQLDKAGVPTTWEELEKYERQLAELADAPGSNPGAPEGA